MNPMAEANSVCTTSDDLEGPISNVLDMAGIAVVVFDYASGEVIPNGTFVRVDRATWGLLGFAIRHQQELAKALFDAFETRVGDAP
jgi:hypothetical protein